MANFDDITGWWDELWAVRKTDAYKSLFPADTIERAKNPPMKMPVEWVLELIQVIMRHEELRDAYLTYGNWVLENHFDADGNRVGLDDGLPEDFPGAAAETARWFVNWFVYIGKKPPKFIDGMSSIPIAVAEVVAKTGSKSTVQSVVADLEFFGRDKIFDLSGLEDGDVWRKNYRYRYA